MSYFTIGCVVSLLILSIFLWKYEKKLFASHRKFKRYRFPVYLLNRSIFIITLLTLVKLISDFFNIDHNVILNVDIIILAVIISSSYIAKKIFLHHIVSITQNSLVIRKIKFMLRLSIVLIILYAISSILKLPAAYSIILLSTIVFMITMSFFFYLQERIILHLDKKKIDKTVVIFFSRVFMIVAVITFVVVLMQVFQISTAPLLTIVGAASIAIGLSLQSSLSNLAAGILLIIFRPYRIGNIIAIASNKGTVEDISFLFTKIRTFSGEHVFIPNSQAISSSGVTNFTLCKFRRIEILVGVDYVTNVNNAIKIGLEALQKHPAVLKNPESKALIHDFADSAITMKYWLYVKPKDYSDFNLEAKTILFQAFKDNGIEIPFNRIVVEMNSES